MDIDLILSRADYHLPLFADFILHQYRDLKTSDPESARKIEDRIFTRSFLLNIMDNGDMLMNSFLFAHVPPEFFAPVMDELTDGFKNGSLLDYGKKIDTIIKANAPELFLDHLKQTLQEQIKQEPVTTLTFYWHNYFEDLPLNLRQEYFDLTLPLFFRESASLADSPNFRAVLSNQTSAALFLNRPEAVPLAKNVLEHLIRNYDKNDLHDYELCCLFRRVLTPEKFITGYRFELDLFFALENNASTTAPKLLDYLYKDGWNGLRIFEFYRNILRSENFSETSMILEHLGSITEPLPAVIIRTLIQDKALMLLLESRGLHHGVQAVFASLFLQFHRKDDIDPALFSDADVLEFITFDFEYIPCLSRIKTYLSGIPSHRMTDLLCTALEKSLGLLEQENRGEYAVAHIMELMMHFKAPSFVPGLINVFLYDDDRLPENMITCLACFGDTAIDGLDTKMGEIPESKLLDVLTIIRKVGTERAEALLIRQFDRFLNSFKADTLSICKSLISRKALDLLSHKVGKKQKAIDELYVIVNVLQGTSDEKTKMILEDLSRSEKSLGAVLELLNSGTAKPVLTLALKCGHCGDISDYECSNVIICGQGDIYIADEPACISCNRISEFTLTPMGRMAVSAEILRLTALKSRDQTESIPFTGALRLINSAVKGKQMSISQGIALYKEEIRKRPKNPDHYIGLGNIYKMMNQYTFAEEQYANAIVHGPFCIEAYLSLAEIAYDKKDFTTALHRLEEGRPYLKRPLICKDIQVTPEEIMETYISFHSDLLIQTGSRIPPILPSECTMAGKQMKKIGRNEKCPCGSGKKYKACCMKKR